jgi:hypothetical protein
MNSPSPQPPRTPPSVMQHVMWSLLLVAACVVLAKIATPLLAWLGFR